jgi:hypothetical protein
MLASCKGHAAVVNLLLAAGAVQQVQNKVRIGRDSSLLRGKSGLMERTLMIDVVVAWCYRIEWEDCAHGSGGVGPRRGGEAAGG